MARKYDAIDVMKMYSTLTLPHWKGLLVDAVRNSRVEKLVAWRYGMQLGLAQANANGHVTTQKVDLWCIKRMRDLEKAMRMILKKKHPSPFDNPKADPVGYIARVQETKRKRDREFEDFLRRSSY